MRILIVDDHPDASESMATVFRLWGHAVRAVRTAEEGKILLATRRMDIAIIDWWLDGSLEGLGTNVIRWARETGIDIPLILITGVPEAVTPKTVFSDLESLPGVKVLHKPIEPEMLMHAMEQLMEGRELLAVDPHGDSWADAKTVPT